MVAITELAAAEAQNKHAASGQAAAPPAHDPVQLARMQKAVKVLIEGLGEDVTREGLIDTPKRVAKALLDVSRGYRQTGASVIGDALFHEPIVNQGNNGVVLVRDIDYASTSEETLLPFYGRAHIAYVPVNGVVLGLSKLARVTRLYGKRLQTQEKLCLDVAEAMRNHVGCTSVAVIVEARHLVPGPAPPKVATACLAGDFAEQPNTWQELLALLGIPEPPAQNVTRLGPAGPNHVDATIQPQAAGNEDSSSAASTSSGTEEDEDVGNDTSRNGTGNDVVLDTEAGSTIEAAVQQLLVEMGEDPTRPALQGSAQRYLRCMTASTLGYHQQLPRRLHRSIPWGTPVEPAAATAGATAVGSSDDDEIMSSSSEQPGSLSGGSPKAGQTLAGAPTEADVHVVGGLHFYSQCEHHMLPFYGSLAFAYVPGPGCAPLSEAEVEHIVAMFTHRLQVQERITHQVADAVQEVAEARGVMVVARAAHMCMVARGVENHSGSTTSLAVRGVFEGQRELRLGMMKRLQELTQQ